MMSLLITNKAGGDYHLKLISLKYSTFGSTQRTAADEARDETRRLARNQTAKLDEIHESARAAAQGREYNVDVSVRKSRRNNRGMSKFLRRVTNRAEGEVFDTTFVMTPKPSVGEQRGNGFPVRPILPR